MRTLFISVLCLALLAGCISTFGGSPIKCIKEVPADHAVIEVEMFDAGIYVPYFKKIFIKKNRHWRAKKRTLKHELCHVTEWQECLPLGALTGWHEPGQVRIWSIALQSNENCEVK